MSPTFPEPDGESDPATLVARLLAFQRASALDRARSLPHDVRRESVLPSGWTPLELISHLVHVERRWILWGFLGLPVDGPWGDQDPAGSGRWSVAPEVSLDDLASQWEQLAARTESVLAATPWDRPAAVTGRFAPDRLGEPPTDPPTEPPTLGAIALHLVQENARHLGHLDVVAELAGGSTGE